MQIGQPATDFELPDPAGEVHRLHDYRGKIVVLNFWSCECMHSERTDPVLLSRLKEWHGEVVLLSVASNRNESTREVEKTAKARGLPVVLLDANHLVADRYGVQITPEAFVVDPDGLLRYHGALDDVSFRIKSPSRFYLDEVVGALLEGRPPGLTEIPPFGCAVVREI